MNVPNGYSLHDPAVKMKVVLCLAVFALVAVAVHGNACVHGDATTCTHSCPDTESKVCEHGICTCAVVTACSDKADCPACPEVTDPHGNTHQEESHCVDRVCQCLPPHGGPPHGGPVGR